VLATDDAVAAPFTPLDDEAVAELLSHAYGLTATAVVRLESERDDTIKVVAGAGEYTLKVANPHEDPAVLAMQSAAVQYAAAADPDLPLPTPVARLDGRILGAVDTHEGPRVARLLAYLPGTCLDYEASTAAQRYACGQSMARLSLALRGFEHPAGTRRLSWDLLQLGSLRPLLAHVPDPGTRRDVSAVLASFETRVLPTLADRPHQVLHNDFNPGNVLVDPGSPGYVTGILDFGETVRTAVVADVAVAMAYAAYDPDQPWQAPQDLLAGYLSRRPLCAAELELVPDLMRGRLAQRLLLNSWMAGTTTSGAARAARHLHPTADALARLLRSEPAGPILEGARP
jgi:Ser/Thr protein kinase RdoA (MazF antagonist)